MNEPEELRKSERDCQRLSADIAALMLRHPGSRWALHPVRSFVKWIERKIDEDLKEDGWR